MATQSAFRFYLVRHAKAESKGGKDDVARRLTPEGRTRFAALARAVAGRVELSRIVTSPFARARETAKLLSDATGAPVGEDDALASGASSGEELLGLARRLGAGVAVVGHNPEIAEAVALAAGREVDVKAGAIAAVDAAADGLHLAWLERPPDVD